MVRRGASRREFLTAAAGCGGFLLLAEGGALFRILGGEPAGAPEGLDAIVEAAPVERYWTCTACHSVSGRGRCRARRNVDGQLRSPVHGRPITQHTDPIEKKPFFRFLPGAAAFSLATSGCPFHFTRFHPDYQLRNLPPPPVATLEKAREIGRKEGLRYACVGNVPGHPGNHTCCPKCGKAVIERDGMFVSAMRLAAGACPCCKTKIAGVPRRS